MSLICKWGCHFCKTFIYSYNIFFVCLFVLFPASAWHCLGFEGIFLLEDHLIHDFHIHITYMFCWNICSVSVFPVQLMMMMVVLLSKN